MSRTAPLYSELARRCRESFAGPENETGVCELCVYRRGKLIDRFYLQVLRHRAFFSRRQPERIDGSIYADINLLVMILAESETLDFRDERVKLLYRTKGDPWFLNTVFISVTRPSSSVLALHTDMERETASHPDTLELRRVRPMDCATVFDCIRHCTPALLNDLHLHWELADKGEREFLRAYGDTEIYGVGTALTMRDLFRRDGAVARDTGYTNGSDLPKSLEQAFPPPFLPRRLTSKGQVWAGWPRAQQATPVTAFHRDIATAFLGHVFGQKRVLLLPPHAAKYIPTQVGYNNYQRFKSGALPRNPDDVVRLYPETIDVTLNANELLVIPVGWFHCVYVTAGPALSISYFWKHESEVRWRQGTEENCQRRGRL